MEVHAETLWFYARVRTFIAWKLNTLVDAGKERRLFVKFDVSRLKPRIASKRKVGVGSN